jgi:hypothetical protein
VSNHDWACAAAAQQHILLLLLLLLLHCCSSAAAAAASHWARRPQAARLAVLPPWQLQLGVGAGAAGQSCAKRSWQIQLGGHHLHSTAQHSTPRHSTARYSSALDIRGHQRGGEQLIQAPNGAVDQTYKMVTICTAQHSMGWHCSGSGMTRRQHNRCIGQGTIFRSQGSTGQHVATGE